MLLFSYYRNLYIWCEYKYERLNIFRMSLFRRLLNPRKKKQEAPSQKTEVSKYTPEPDTPMDEKFVTHFCKNGGKFLYCENMNEVSEAFDSILLESDWYETQVYCLDKNLSQKFNGYNLDFKTNNDNKTSFMLTTCESLVADNGSILLSSNQLKGRKLWELPKDIVIFAKTSQIVGNISDGMQIIKMESKNGIPVDITTIRHFREVEKEDFMTYGNSNKNVYLLLLEDL